MRLSRPRVILRAALLLVGGAFMLWKALASWSASRAGAADEAVLLARVAAVEALVGILALAAAALALLALRSRRRTHTLHLGDLTPKGDDREGARRPPVR